MSDDTYELCAIRYGTDVSRRRVENLMWVAPDDPHDMPMPMPMPMEVLVLAGTVPA